MAKKLKIKESPKKEMKSNFLEIHWGKIVMVILFLLPFIYFVRFLSPNTMIAGSDYLIGGYPFEKWSAGQKELPLWYPHVFGGIPVLGAPVGGPLAPLAQLKRIMPPQVALAWSFIIFFFIAGVGMYLYLKELGLSKYSAAVGAFIYQFIGNLGTTPEAGHAGRAASVALFPLMLLSLQHALKTKKFIFFVLLSAITALAFYEGHFQITYYGLLFMLGYLVYYLIAHRKEQSKNDWLKIFGYGLCAILLIFLLMAAVWLPVLGGLKTAARGVERGYEYATSWALAPVEIFDLLVPSYSGGLENYWSTNAFKLHTEYFGLLAIIFALFAIVFYWKRPYVKFYLIGAIVVILYCFGGATPFFRIFYHLIPGFKLFRAPNLAFYLASFSFIVLGSIGFENIIIKSEIKKKEFFMTAGILIISFIVLLFLIAPALGREAAGQKLGNFEKNFSSYINGVWISLFIIFAIFVLIYLSIYQKLKLPIATLVAILITIISQLPIMAKYLPKGSAPDKYYAADDIIRFLKKDKGIFRVFPFQSAPPLNPQYLYHAQDCYLLYHDIQSAGGYIANPIQRYQDFIGSGASVMFTPVNLFLCSRFVDMLNLKYVIAPNLPEEISRYDENTQKFILNIKNYLSRFINTYQGREYSVYQNDSALPRAYIVPDYQVVKETEVLKVLASENFNPRQTVIIEENPNVPHPENSAPMLEAKILEYSANKIVCQTDCPYPGFLVLTDNWHPDWKVFVDGKREKLHRANYVFRAVYVPAGKHKIVFKYISTPFNSGKIISIITLIGVIAIWIILIKPTTLLKKH